MSDYAIETRGLSKRYGRLQAVSELDLRVPAGVIYGFLGPNGAGKSTTIRMLMGLIRATGGEAWLLGRRVTADHPVARTAVGALVEGPAFVDYLSAKRNLQMLAALSGVRGREQVQEALEHVGLAGRQNDRVRTFSHGMKQRLGLAGALIGNPRLIILDEPAQGLDPQGLVEVRDLLRRLRDERQVTIFLSSHLLHEVQLICDEVGIIRQGRLIASGSVQQLLAAAGRQVLVQVDDPARAAEIARDLEYVEAASVTPEGLSVRLDPDRAADLNAALVAAGLRVSALAPATSDLEQVYMELMQR